MPTDPWRYLCPHCRSHSVKRLTNHINNLRPPGKTYTAGGVGVTEAREDRRKRWTCKECRERFERPIDKKAGYVRA